MGKFKELLNGNFQRNKKIWKTDLAIVSIFFVVALVVIFWNPALPSELDVNTWTDKLGVSGPLALMLTVIIESVIAPLPGTFISIAAGVLYGVWPGMLYVWIANVIGSTLSFWIARKLGRPIVRRLIKEKTIERYDKFLRRNRFLIILMYSVPIFPLDMIGYVIGLADMPYRKYIVIITCGFAINLFILTSFGDHLLTASGGVKALYALLIMVIIIAASTTEKIINRKTELT